LPHFASQLSRSHSHTLTVAFKIVLEKVEFVAVVFSARPKTECVCVCLNKSNYLADCAVAYKKPKEQRRTRLDRAAQYSSLFSWKLNCTYNANGENRSVEVHTYICMCACVGCPIGSDWCAISAAPPSQTCLPPLAVPPPQPWSFAVLCLVLPCFLFLLCLSETLLCFSSAIAFVLHSLSLSMPIVCGSIFKVVRVSYAHTHAYTYILVHTYTHTSFSTSLFTIHLLPFSAIGTRRIKLVYDSLQSIRQGQSTSTFPPLPRFPFHLLPTRRRRRGAHITFLHGVSHTLRMPPRNFAPLFKHRVPAKCKI